MADLSSQGTLNRLHALLTAAPDGLLVFQHGQTLPEPLPPAFVVLQPLPGMMTQRWATRRYVDQSIRILCCATGPGTARSMVQEVNKRLPAAEFHVVGTNFENHSGTHYEIPVTVQTVT